MPNLTNEEIQQFQSLLQAEQNRLQLRLSELKAQDPFNDPEHSNDNAAIDKDASEESDHDRVAALIEQTEIQLKQVADALLRIQDETYGICTNCGNHIGINRIKVNPTALLCIDCENVSA